MNFTKEQEQAIYSRGQDILVSAGAGAGKTRVLVSRISEMILDEEHPVTADQFLVLTFTNAAAREMKERIIKELEERLEADPDNRYLRRQIRVIKHADISTVHSFCNHLIRTHFHELGLDPAFRIGEEGELKLLKQECMESLLEEAYLAGQESFVNLVEAYAPGRDDRALEDMIEKIYTFSRNFADSNGWFDKVERDFEAMMTEEGANKSEIFQSLVESAKRQIESLPALFRHAFSFFDESKEPKIVYDYIEREYQQLQELQKAQSFVELYDILHSIDFPRYPTKNMKVCKNWNDFYEVKKAHEAFKKMVDGLCASYFLKSMSAVRIEQKAIDPMLKECISLVKRYEELISIRKKEKNIYSFDDLEHYALTLLVDHYDEDGNAVPSQTASEIARHYKAIFVDEYQDTSVVQETILTTLLQSGQNQGCNLFVVGDLKQSIYRFRQARPDLFLKRYHSYEEGEGLKIELRDNFRSSPDVLDFCNLFFQRWMTEDFGGIRYDDKICLLAGENGPMREVHEKQEVMLLVEDDEAIVYGEDVSKILAEAVMIGERIDGLLEEGYSYEDMVILLRSVKGKGQIMADYLESKGIPTLCESQIGYFQTREIRVMLNYLSVIDNVYRDVSMACVLLSGIGGFTSEELAKLKIQVDASMRRKSSLFELLQIYLQEGQEEVLKEKIHSFLKQLEKFRQKKQEMLLHELLWEIYQETGFYEEVLSMPYGEKRRENLLVLLKHAEEYEKTMFKGLFYFIRHMEQLQIYEVEPGSGSVDESDHKAVKIMTIHKSKGLEYPVVFVSDLSKQFNRMDVNQSILYHPTLGIGMEYYNLEERVHSPSIVKNAIKDRILKEGAEEELRILYVAMTRAQRKLILTGVISEKQRSQMENGEGMIHHAQDAKSFMDWILPVLYEQKFECSWYHYHQISESMDQQSLDKEEKKLEELLEIEEVKVAPYTSVEKAFSRTYPYEDRISWKRKYSVSELKKMSMQELPEEEKVASAFTAERTKEELMPAFLSEEKEEMKGTAYGTMVHKVMELLPFGQIKTRKALKEELDRLSAQLNDLTPFMKKKVYKGVETFLFSEYGQMIQQMDQEKRLYKEYPFTIGLDASLVYGEKGLENEEKDPSDLIVLQGIIDLYGEWEGALWLLDYKTDRIEEGQEDILLDRYEKQMLYYKLALEQMLEKKVDQILIYSFALEKFIKIDV